MKVRELIEQLQRQDGDSKVLVVVEPTDRKVDGDVDVAFEIDKVVRENCNGVHVNILVW